MRTGTHHTVVSRLPLREPWDDPAAVNGSLKGLFALAPPAPLRNLQCEQRADLDARIRDHFLVTPVSAIAYSAAEGLLAVGGPNGWQISRRGVVLAQDKQEQPSAVMFETEQSGTYLTVASALRLRSFSLTDHKYVGSCSWPKNITSMVPDPERRQIFISRSVAGNNGGAHGGVVEIMAACKCGLDVRCIELYRNEKSRITALALWLGRPRIFAVGLENGEIEVRRAPLRCANGGEDLLWKHRPFRQGAVTALSFPRERVLLAANALGNIAEIDFGNIPTVRISCSSPRFARVRGAVRALAVGPEDDIHAFSGRSVRE